MVVWEQGLRSWLFNREQEEVQNYSDRRLVFSREAFYQAANKKRARNLLASVASLNTRVISEANTINNQNWLIKRQNNDLKPKRGQPESSVLLNVD